MSALAMPYQMVNAVDGRRLSLQQLAMQYDESRASTAYRSMTPGEIGCALSHASVYEQMVRANQDFALVLEDDAYLSEQVPSVLDLLRQTMDPNEPIVLLLTHVNRYVQLGKRNLGQNHAMVRPYAYWWLAHGYVLTRAAAVALHKNVHPIWTAADSWNAFDRLGIVKVYALVPYCIGLTELAQQSNLELERKPLRFADELNRTWKYYIKKYLYDRLIFQLCVRPFLRVTKQPMGL